MKPKVVCIIPARLESTRFPRKLLKSLGGKPILQRVWEAATSCLEFDEVLFAIDSNPVREIIEGFGGRWEMTSVDHPNGTSRMAELLQENRVEGDIWVNWQGDEPFIQREMIQTLLSGIDNQEIMAWTLKKEIKEEAMIQDSSTVKVVADQRDTAIYFSRSPIPYDRDGEGATYYKHIGLYAYRKELLAQIPNLPMTPLARAESLEQLVLLEHGYKMQVFETKTDTIGIDKAQDLLKAENYLTVFDKIK